MQVVGHDRIHRRSLRTRGDSPRSPTASGTVSAGHASRRRSRNTQGRRGPGVWNVRHRDGHGAWLSRFVVNEPGCAVVRGLGEVRTCGLCSVTLCLVTVEMVQVADGVDEGQQHGCECCEDLKTRATAGSDHGQDAGRAPESVPAGRGVWDAAVGCAGGEVVGVRRLAQVVVAGRLGRGAEEVGGRPAGVACRVGIGDGVAADLGGGELGCAGDVAVDRTAFFGREFDGWCRGWGSVPGPAQVRPGQALCEFASGVPGGAALGVMVVWEGDGIPGDHTGVLDAVPGLDDDPCGVQVGEEVCGGPGPVRGLTNGGPEASADGSSVQASSGYRWNDRGPARSEFGQGQVGGEFAAAVPDHWSCGLPIARQRDRVAGSPGLGGLGCSGGGPVPRPRAAARRTRPPSVRWRLRPGRGGGEWSGILLPSRDAESSAFRRGWGGGRRSSPPGRSAVVRVRLPPRDRRPGSGIRSARCSDECRRCGPAWRPRGCGRRRAGRRSSGRRWGRPPARVRDGPSSGQRSAPIAHRSGPGPRARHAGTGARRVCRSSGPPAASQGV